MELILFDKILMTVAVLASFSYIILIIGDNKILSFFAATMFYALGVLSFVRLITLIWGIDVSVWTLSN